MIWATVSRMGVSAFDCSGFNHSAVAYEDRRGSAPPIARPSLLRIAFTPPMRRDQPSTIFTVQPALISASFHWEGHLLSQQNLLPVVVAQARPLNSGLDIEPLLEVAS